jgi:hypothetical protein
MVQSYRVQAWFFLIGPLILGAYGLLLLFDLFGTTKDMTNFYKGRGDWYPILPGDDSATHRFVGAILLATAVVLTIAMWGMHVL